MSRTFLTVAFREKDAAKALGARWDGTERRWYVPDGLELAQFAAWLPAQAGAVVKTSSLLPATEAAPAQRGIPLSQLLNGVARTVAAAYGEGVWTTTEVLRVSARGGHVYLELSERTADGNVVAKAQAAIWSRTAERIIPEFEQATGAILSAGIKLLVRARPVFKAQFGFSLEIDGIDPTYTLGDLEAKKREIRERLKREGLFEMNRSLAPPWDFLRVLVVSPEAAAGHGDFAAEAARLERFGVCNFTYMHSRFQGEGAAAEIRTALLTGLAQSEALDAVIIIRGGGAVNDLAWLNDYDLARAICECAVPVLTGIGHERDDTVLDEVAHRRFDTPSKVVGGIEQHIVSRARAAQANFELVVTQAQRTSERARAQTEKFEQEVQSSAASALQQARAQGAQLMGNIGEAAREALHLADRQAREQIAGIRHGAMTELALAQQAVPTALDSVLRHAQTSVKAAGQACTAALPTVLSGAANNLKHAAAAANRQMQSVARDAHAAVSSATGAAQSLFREIAGQGPSKTLQRGFAMVRGPDGATLTSARRVEGLLDPVEISFSDGVVHATIQSVRLEADKESKDESK